MTEEQNLKGDHDLLIRLDEKVEGLTKAIVELNSNTLRRLEDVENTKAGRDELNVVLDTLNKAIAREEASRVTADRDVETRMRSVERFVYIAMGIAIILQLVVLPVVLKFFFK